MNGSPDCKIFILDSSFETLYDSIVISHAQDNAKESYWALSAWDPLPQESIFPKAFQGKEVRSTTPSDWLVYYPINKRCWGYRVDAPPAKVAPWGSVDPKMVRIGSSDMDDRHVRRISLELQWEKPAWGVIRLTGPVFGWSSGTQMSKEVERVSCMDNNYPRTQLVWMSLNT